MCGLMKNLRCLFGHFRPAARDVLPNFLPVRIVASFSAVSANASRIATCIGIHLVCPVDMPTRRVSYALTTETRSVS